MNFGKRVKMNDGRNGVIIGYSSALGAYNIAIETDVDGSYRVLEWRTDFKFIDDGIKSYRDNLIDRIKSFNERIEGTKDLVLNSCFVGWRDATEIALKELNTLCNNL